MLIFVLLQFECCGLKGAADFLAATEWRKYYNVSGILRRLPIPLICCRADKKYPFGLANDIICTTQPDATNSFTKVRFIMLPC